MAFLSRRSVLCASAALLLPREMAAQSAPGKAPAANKRGDGELAEVIDDPRVETLDMGPADAPWRIFIGRPRVAAPAGGYSALLALDGNASFPLLWHAREALTPEAPVLIVGIGYPTAYRFDTARRYLDLTPFTPPENFGGRSSDRATGGRKAFLDFIEGILLPGIVQHGVTDPARCSLFGHSLGGLFALYTLYERSSMFGSYVTADPSIWWNKGSILEEEARFREKLASSASQTPIRLLMENSGAERRDRTDTRGAPEFSGRLAAERLAATGRMAVSYRLFAEETHPTMLAPSIRDALLFHLGDGAGQPEPVFRPIATQPG